MDNASHTSPLPDTPRSTPNLSGQTIDDFHLQRKLGQGGMGQVYLAEQRSLGRKVALKLLKPELAADETALKRFDAEARAAARVSHPNIVQVYAIGKWQGTLYMALEYVEGRNLRDHLARKGTPNVPQALSILRQVAEALQRAHEHGIIHRDIKPENILLTRKHEVKVADFGLSRILEAGRPALNLTQSGVTLGTPLYMSPEQVEGKPVDARSDIYSFGVTCYHMLAGAPPYKGSTAFEVALQHVRGEPEPLSAVRPDLPPELCAVIHKMMARDPAARYQTCRDLLQELAQVQVGAGVSGLVPLSVSMSGEAVKAPSRQLTPARPRRGWKVAAFVATLLLAGGAGAALGWIRQQDRSPADGEELAPVENAQAVEGLSRANLEQLKEKLVAHYLDPANGFKEADRDSAVRDCLDLGLYYLDQNRLDEADELFKRLHGIKQVPQFHQLGQLGRALVEALKDNRGAALSMFGEVTPRPFVAELVRTNRGLRRWLAEAAYHIEAYGPVAGKKPPVLVPYLRDTPPRRPLDTKPPKKNGERAP